MRRFLVVLISIWAASTGAMYFLWWLHNLGPGGVLGASAIASIGVALVVSVLVEAVIELAGLLGDEEE